MKRHSLFLIIGYALTGSVDAQINLGANLGATISLGPTLNVGANVNLQASINLGTASQFAVLGATTVANTGDKTNVSGNVGVYPSTSVTGFPPGITYEGGTIHSGDTLAATAHIDATGAYTALSALAVTTDLTGKALGPTADTSGSDLGGRTLTPGVYRFSSSGALTGRLTLDGQGNANSVFVIQTGSTLTTAINSAVTLINGAQTCNIFFQIGSSATLGLNSIIYGNILAQQSIAVTAGTAVNGRLYAINGAISFGGSVGVRTPTTCSTTLAITTTTSSGPSILSVIASLGPSTTLSILPLSTPTFSSTSTASSVSTAPRIDGRCGRDFNGATCDPNGAYGGCCSQFGYCGITPGQYVFPNISYEAFTEDLHLAVLLKTAIKTDAATV
ncbi:MAG: hypothetical protein M1812_003876 [Candelaria pacifica]|nr:MAG: hypothetical protein M1812_003876 [Candelaria pacifica]